MDSVSIPLGCVITDEGKAVSTIYTSCIDTEKLVYYFKTYDSLRLCAVRFTNELFDLKDFTVFEIYRTEEITSLN